MATEPTLRKQIISACQEMNSLGINQGTSGKYFRSTREKNVDISFSDSVQSDEADSKFASLNFGG